MKKTYLLLPIFFLASCSSSNDDTSLPDNNGNNNEPTPVLVTKVVADGDTSVYSYNGTKINQIKNITDGTVTSFTYTGDLITQISTAGSSTSTTIKYTYDGSNKLSKKVVVISNTSPSIPPSTVETNFTYLANNNVKIALTYTSSASSPRTETRNAILNADGSLNSWTGTGTIPTGSTTSNATLTLKPVVYDSKNNPFKNITGFSKIIDPDDEYGYGSIHNVLDYNYVLQYNTGTEWTIFKSSLEYNGSNYPTKETRNYYNKTGTGITSTDISTFEYNHL